MGEPRCSANLPLSSVSSPRFKQLRYFCPNRRKLRRFPILAPVTIMMHAASGTRLIAESGGRSPSQATPAMLAPTQALSSTHQAAREPATIFGYSLSIPRSPNNPIDLTQR